MPHAFDDIVESMLSAKPKTRAIEPPRKKSPLDDIVESMLSAAPVTGPPTPTILTPAPEPSPTPRLAPVSAQTSTTTVPTKPMTRIPGSKTYGPGIGPDGIPLPGYDEYGWPIAPRGSGLEFRVQREVGPTEPPTLPPAGYTPPPSASEIIAASAKGAATGLVSGMGGAMSAAGTLIKDPTFSPVAQALKLPVVRPAPISPEAAAVASGLQKAGRGVSEFVRTAQEEAAKSIPEKYGEDIIKDGKLNMDLLADPVWWAATMVTVPVSQLPFFVAGALTGPAGATATESLIEAGETFNRAKAAGQSDEAAGKLAAEVFAKNAMITLPVGHLFFGSKARRLLKKIPGLAPIERVAGKVPGGKFVAKRTAEGIPEAGQEFGQSKIQTQAERTYNPEAEGQPFTEALAGFVGGVSTGTAMEGVRGRKKKPTKGVISALAAAQRPAPTTPEEARLAYEQAARPRRGALPRIEIGPVRETTEEEREQAKRAYQEAVRPEPLGVFEGIDDPIKKIFPGAIYRRADVRAFAEASSKEQWVPQTPGGRVNFSTVPLRDRVYSNAGVEGGVLGVFKREDYPDIEPFGGPEKEAELSGRNVPYRKPVLLITRTDEIAENFKRLVETKSIIGAEGLSGIPIISASQIRAGEPIPVQEVTEEPPKAPETPPAPPLIPAPKIATPAKLAPITVEEWERLTPEQQQERTNLLGEERGAPEPPQAPPPPAPRPANLRADEIEQDIADFEAEQRDLDLRAQDIRRRLKAGQKAYKPPPAVGGIEGGESPSDFLVSAGGAKFDRAMFGELEDMPKDRYRKGLIARTGGTSADILVDRMRTEHPEWGIETESDLLALLREGGDRLYTAGGDFGLAEDMGQALSPEDELDMMGSAELKAELETVREQIARSKTNLRELMAERGVGGEKEARPEPEEKPEEKEKPFDLFYGPRFPAARAAAEGAAPGVTPPAKSQENRTAYDDALFANIYHTKDQRLRRLAYGVKSGDPDTVREVATEMSSLLPDPENAILVPIPGHTGETRSNLLVAQEIARQTGATVQDVLKREVGPSQREARKAGRPILKPGEMGMVSTKALPVGRVYFVDNVIASGSTIRAARDAVGGGRGLVFAKALNRETKYYEPSEPGAGARPAELGVSTEILAQRDRARERSKAAREEFEQKNEQLRTEARERGLRFYNPKPREENLRRFMEGSRVVDEEGNPLVVYHGTPSSDWTEFDPFRTDLGLHMSPVREVASFMAGRRAPGARVYPLYASIKNPLRLADLGSFQPESVVPQLREKGIVSSDKADDMMGWDSSELRAFLMGKGYDGVVYLNRREVFARGEGDSAGQFFGIGPTVANKMTDTEFKGRFPGAEDSYIAFSPEQIKSATGNRGTFDPTNPDIVYYHPGEDVTVNSQPRTVVHSAPGETTVIDPDTGKIDLVDPADITRTKPAPQRATGTDAILSRLDAGVREQGLDPAVADAGRAFVEALDRTGYLVDLEVQVREEEGPQARYTADVGATGRRVNALVELFSRSATDPRASVHDLVHHLEQFVPEEDMAPLRDRYEREKAAYERRKSTLGALARAGRGEFSPEAGYRFERNFSEYFAERVADLELVRQGQIKAEADAGVWTRPALKLKHLIQTYWNIVRDYLRRDAARQIYDNLRLGRYGIEYEAGAERPSVARYEAGAKPAEPFYSQLRRTIETRMGGQQDAASLKAMLEKSPGVKREEIEDTGLFSWLDQQQGKVKRGDVLQYLDENTVEVEVIEHGRKGIAQWKKDLLTTSYDSKADAEDAVEEALPPDEEWAGWEAIQGNDDRWYLENRFIDEKGDAEALEVTTLRYPPAQYADYWMPGGENHREMLLTLPTLGAGKYRIPEGFRVERITNRQIQEWKNEPLESLSNATRGDWILVEGDEPPLDVVPGNLSRDEAVQNLIRSARDAFGPDELVTVSGYRSTHFPEPNVLAHVRMADHTGPNGERVLLVDEVQSDWHKEGRARGYKGGISATDFLKQRGIDISRFSERQIENKARALGIEKEGVPSAPWKKTWHERAMKEVVRFAAENGYDRIAWTIGEQQADRYDLSKHLSEVHYSGTNLKAYDHKGKAVIERTGVKPEDLPDYVGKEVAQRLMDQTPKGTLRSLTGLDLKVGGEWAAALYDRAIPRFMSDYAKKMKWGSQPEDVALDQRKFRVVKSEGYPKGMPWEVRDEAGQLEGRYVSQESAQVRADTMSVSESGPSIHSIALTPEARDQVIYQGQPRYYDPKDREKNLRRFMRRAHGLMFTSSGKPKELFHGTRADFNVFEGGYTFLSDDPTFASAITEAGPKRPGEPNVMMVYANLKNPLDLRDLPALSTNRARFVAKLKEAGLDVNPEMFPHNQKVHNHLNGQISRRRIREAAIKAGYDGIAFKDVVNDIYATSYIAFYPEQVKSATGNRGTFDPTQKTILEYDPQAEGETPKEKLPPGVKERQLPKSLEEAGQFGGYDRTYEVATDAEAARIVQERIKSPGAAYDELVGKEAWDKPDVVTALALAGQYGREARRLTDEGAAAGEKPGQGKLAESARFFERQIALTTMASRKATTQGQAIQALSMVDMLDPDGVLVYAQRKIDDINEGRPESKKQKLTQKEAAKLQALAETGRAARALDVRSQEIASLSDRVFSGKPLSKEEWKRFKELSRAIEVSAPRRKSKKLPDLSQLGYAERVRQGKAPKSTELKAPPVLERAKSRLDLAAEAARERIRARRGQIQALVDPQDVSDAIIIGAAELGKKGIDFAGWSKNMVSEFGEGIRESLRDVFDKSRAIYKQAREIELLTNRALRKIQEAEYDVDREAPARKVQDLARAYEALKAAPEGEEGEAARQVQQALKDLGRKEKPISALAQAQTKGEKALARLMKRAEDTLREEEFDPDRPLGPEAAKRLAQAVAKLKTMTGAAKIEAAQEVVQAIAMLEKPTFMGAVGAIYMTNMLSGTKTLLTRNPLGNEGLYRLGRIARFALSPTVDRIVTRAAKTGERTVVFEVNTQGFDWGRFLRGDVRGAFEKDNYWTALVDGARRSWKGLPATVKETEDKFEMGRVPQFRGKGLVQRGIEAATGKSIETEINLPAIYVKGVTLMLDAFDNAGWVRARNATLGDMAKAAWYNKGKPPDKKAFVENYLKNLPPDVLEWGESEANYYTLKDPTLLSTVLIGAKKLLNLDPKMIGMINKRTGEYLKARGWKGAFGPGTVEFPFGQVPGSLTMKTIDFSPVGLLRGMYILSKGMAGARGGEGRIGRWGRGTEFDQRETVKAITNGITGFVGFTLLGYWMVSLGLIGGGDDEREVREFKREHAGEPSRLWVNPKGTRRWAASGFNAEAAKRQEGDVLFTVDWASPAAVNLAMTVETWNRVREKGGVGGMDLSQIAIEALSAGAQTMLEVPMLQTIRRTLRPVREGESAIKPLVDALEGVPATLMAPSILNEVRQYVDNRGRVTHDPTPYQRALNRALYRLPWISKSLPLAYKTLGEEVPREIYQDGRNTLFNVFLNPGFVSTYKIDPTISMLLRPYEEAGETKQFPKLLRPRQEFSASSLNRVLGGKDFVDPITIDLTKEEFSELQRVTSTFTTQKFNRVGSLSQDPEKAAQELSRVANEAAQEAKDWFIDSILAPNHQDALQKALPGPKPSPLKRLGDLNRTAKAKAA